ncbi:MAG: hypothetical protein ACI8P3_004598 [Saprospiraceae bacterium]|jgi:hypothetical protein
MEVKKLQAKIQEFKSFLKRDRNFEELYKWESLSHFQEYWDIEAPDFGKMYDQSLRNTKTQRLWKRENWRPKELMLQLIALEPDFPRRIFRKLFDESTNIEPRVSMFKFGCEELLREFKHQHKRTIENNHYHDDFEMIFLYLTFRFPEAFTFYEYRPFIRTLEQLGIHDIPDPYNIERFLKLTKILYIFLKKDEELMSIHRKRLPADRFYASDSKLIVHDFYCFCGR